MTSIVNILTVDVEDWIQSVYDNNAPLSEHFIANTHMVLEHFAYRGVHATFFVLGLAAEKSPELVRAIQSAGHEIQSHGYAHRLVTTQTPAQFAADVRRSKLLLEDIIGRQIVGYRAPAFSLGWNSTWAFDVLAECGMQYDASLCPAQTPRYGMKGIPQSPFQLKTPQGHSLLELPVATRRILGKLIPAGGGGYVRFWPYPFLRTTVSKLNATSTPAVLYLHPYEYNPTELAALRVPIPLRMRLHQSLGRRNVKAKWDRLFRECRFDTVAAWRANTNDLPTFKPFAPPTHCTAGAPPAMTLTPSQ